MVQQPSRDPDLPKRGEIVEPITFREINKYCIRIKQNIGILTFRRGTAPCTGPDCGLVESRCSGGYHGSAADTT